MVVGTARVETAPTAPKAAVARVAHQPGVEAIHSAAAPTIMPPPMRPPATDVSPPVVTSPIASGAPSRDEVQQLLRELIAKVPAAAAKAPSLAEAVRLVELGDTGDAGRAIRAAAGIQQLEAAGASGVLGQRRQ